VAEHHTSHGVIVLAAGASTRLGSPKQLLMHRGEVLVRRALCSALATQPAAAVIVVGAQADAVYAAVADLGVQRVDADAWSDGMGASLRAGLAALPDAVDAVLVVLCDQPALDAEHLRQLVAAWNHDRSRAIATAYAGAVGVPALLPRSWFAALREGPGDSGARDLLASRRAEVVMIRNEALAEDVDVAADRGALQEG